MRKLCRVDPAKSEKLFRQLISFVGKIKKELPVHTVYLYGSLVKGEMHEGSDIDILVIGDFKERFFDRIGKILQLTDLPIEPLVYTSDEFEAMKKSDNPFISEVLKNAVIIG